MTCRTLRFWGVAEAIYATLVVVLVAGYVPWKTPVVNLALLGYAGLHAISAPGLLLQTRVGYRVSVAAGILGLAAAVVTCAGLLASWAYLQAISGDFGHGASLGALLCASIVLQILGLYPALKLRALLRREVRSDLGLGPGAVRVICWMLTIPPLLALLIFCYYRIDRLDPLSNDGRAQVISYLRAALNHASRPAMPALEGLPVGKGPLYVTLWHGGQVEARVTGTGPDLKAAVRQAAEALLTSLEKPDGQGIRGRLKIDRIVGISPVLSKAAPILALSVNPGCDGLRRHVGDPLLSSLLPDDLLKEQVFGVSSLFPGIRELRIGLNGGPVLERLGSSGGRLERLHTESWVEYEGSALPVLRGNTPGPASNPEEWQKAAIAGGRFILRQLKGDGRFHYSYLPLTNEHPPGNRYSMPRHAGTIYSLALLYNHTKIDRFRRGAEEALAWLEGRIQEDCGNSEQACVVRNEFAWLGSSALALVGMLEYQRSTEDKRYEQTAGRLANFVLHMQKPNGNFYHLYDAEKDRIYPDMRRMFFSEEAALALVMAHDVLKDRRYLMAAKQALDYLTGPKYDYFLGWFIYGDDHWTCIAAEQAWPHLQSTQYLDFCQGYAHFIGRLQYRPGEWDNRDYTGHYGFGALAVPGAPVTASAAEAVIATYLLSKHHGLPDESLRTQAALALDALSRDQIRLDNSWLLPHPVFAEGGFCRSLVEREVRIDFTQHAASALICGAEM